MAEGRGGKGGKNWNYGLNNASPGGQKASNWLNYVEGLDATRQFVAEARTALRAGQKYNSPDVEVTIPARDQEVTSIVCTVNGFLRFKAVSDN